ncbi:MAG: SRPBCC family protein [Dehalococcoidia bacterium]
MTDGSIEGDGDWRMVRFERTLPYSVERLWSALTDEAELRVWLAEAVVEPVLGGRFELDFSVTGDSGRSLGHVTAVEANRYIEFTWFADRLEDSRVRFEIFPAADGTTLVLTHRFPVSHGVAETLGGWHCHLDALELMARGTPFELRDVPWRQAMSYYLTEVEAK